MQVLQLRPSFGIPLYTQILISDQNNLEGQWFQVLSSNNGRERLGPLRFVNVASSEVVMVVPCTFTKGCYCKKIQHRYLISVQCLNGQIDHIDKQKLDLDNPQQRPCPLCPPDEDYQRNIDFDDHLKNRHLLPAIMRLRTTGTANFRCPLF